MSRLTKSEQVAAWLMGLGVLLVLLGYRGYRYLPITETEKQHERSLQNQLAILREAKSAANPEDAVKLQILYEELQSKSIYLTRIPPYRGWGIAGLLGGLTMLLIGYSMWHRRRHVRTPWTPLNEDA